MANKKKEAVKAGPIFEKTSDNKSAVRLMKDMKKAGVEKYDFFMETKNPAVSGKDPYGQRLDFDDVRNISNECEANLWFYFRECLMLRKDVASEDMGYYPLNMKSIATIVAIDNGYSISLEMNKKMSFQIAHAIFLYYHQAGPISRHFEVVVKNDKDQFEHTEYSSYYFSTPPYIFSQHNYEPIFYETEEVLIDEIKYQKTAGMLILDDPYSLDKIDEAMSKWVKASRKPQLIMLNYNNTEYHNTDNLEIINWDNKFFDSMKNVSNKKKSIIVIK